LASAHLAPYIDVLRRFGPAALYAYPSSAAELARLCREHHLDPPPIRAVFTASETLRPNDARLIEQVFRAPVVDRYGNAERTLAGGHCERGGYHLWSDCTLAEIEPLGNGARELVGTPLHGRAMPLLRYRTGDRTELGAPACPCGRAFPVVAHIDGRSDAALLLPDGRRIGRLDHIWKGVEHVAAGQIVQEADLSIRLRLVPEPGFSPRDRSRIEAHVRARLGPEIPIVIEEVDRLPRTAAGKFLAVVSHVPQVQGRGPVSETP
jgi:phenylacetate-CoA ligase